MTSATDPAPVRATDYAALSAGWGALLGGLLVAARDKGDEPVRSTEARPAAWRLRLRLRLQHHRGNESPPRRPVGPPGGKRGRLLLQDNSYRPSC
jgi:hypothetical protein